MDDDVERAIFDGWRHLRKDAHAVLSLTPRELAIMLRAEQWRKADEYERQSRYVMMAEQAHRAKRPKASDLYRHPSRKPAGDMTDLKEKTRADNEWLSRLVTAGRKE